MLVFEADGINSLPIKASTEIFLGSAVGLTAGYARQLTAGDIFGGFAEQHVNNSVATDGAATIPVKYKGRVLLTVGTAAVTDIGKPVYASDGATFTLTGTSNTRIGTIVRWISTGVVVVAFDGTKSVSVGSALTDNSTGTASGTIASISDTATKNAIASIVAQLNAITAGGQ